MTLDIPVDVILAERDEARRELYPTHVSEAASEKERKNELVINWHMLEACNYRCSYCYAKWAREDKGDIVCRDRTLTTQLLHDLYQFFSPGNPSNPLTTVLSWHSVRLSIAGGEPTLLKGRLQEIVSEAKNIGFATSLITNGTGLNKESLALLAPNLSMLGLSIDSADEHTNRQIGRVDGKGEILKKEQMSEVGSIARSLNPCLVVKVNTVVNAINVDEDLTELIFAMRPDRWKVLRALPAVTDSLSVTDLQFDRFVRRHEELQSVMSLEDNDQMVGSYLMVDPYGRFFQNLPRPLRGYQYSRPIPSVGAAEAYRTISFSPEKFAARYR